MTLWVTLQPVPLYQEHPLPHITQGLTKRVHRLPKTISTAMTSNKKHVCQMNALVFVFHEVLCSWKPNKRLV